ncbi:MAG TPA: hypothetical protein VEU62_12695 [Bryobacterales bacterium]|nr:hypothetical protein [Bryobacterales bacterium]
MEWLWLFKLFPLGDVLRMWMGKRWLRLTVHTAYFENNGRAYYFVNLSNSSRNRELVITHIWFDLNPQVPVMPPERPLPKRLMPEEPWSTWIPADCVPLRPGKDACRLVRARLSTGAAVNSKAEKTVPSSGAVPGWS